MKFKIVVLIACLFALFLSNAAVAAPAQAKLEQRGNQPLPFVMQDGVKVFQLTASVGMWTARKDKPTLEAWTFNGTVPGPVIRVTEGDKVRLVVHNRLPEGTSVHWHSVDVPNGMDGVAHVTQEPIKPGSSFAYEFTIINKPGTFMYHSHFDTATQVMRGMYGMFIVESAHNEKKYDGEFLLMLSGPFGGSHYMVNGKSFPDTDSWTVKPNGRYLVRVANISPMENHPMHFHGHTWTQITKDGRPMRSPIDMTTLDVAPGQTYDMEFTADAKDGTWLFHCHNLMHVMGTVPDSHDITKAHAGMIVVMAYGK
ncbi:MAG: multicopper oxidase domain-containing protein [Patescibacteria group bacterium]